MEICFQVRHLRHPVLGRVAVPSLGKRAEDV